MNNANPYNQEQFERIEKYLLGKMNNTDRVRFEAEIKRDDNLKQQVEEVRELISTVKEESLKEELEEIHADLGYNKPLKTVQTKRKFNYLAIAASIALLVSVGGIWYLSSTSNNQQLYERYFRPDPGLPTVMGNSDNYDFYDAMVNYKQNDYATAIEKWKKLLITKPENDTLNYFIGVSYLAKNNTKSAVPYLEKVTSTASIFKNDAYYYLGLSYLKEDNIEAAKKNFNLSTSENGREILSRLKD